MKNKMTHFFIPLDFLLTDEFLLLLAPDFELMLDFLLFTEALLFLDPFSFSALF
jgi:hypothetical protein